MPITQLISETANSPSNGLATSNKQKASFNKGSASQAPPGIQNHPEDKIILIDTDAGPDDAWAIFMALAAQRNATSRRFTIVGITTVAGNGRVDNVVNNVTRTLNTVNDTTTPIYKGMADPLMESFRFHFDPPFFGDDGFGDANLPPIPTRIESEHSVDAIIRLAETYQGRLSVVCLGPLTNLAMAVKKRPEIKNFVKELYILGGNVEGLGNTTMNGEFNFYFDPESAHIVLKDFSPCPITIVPWETCARSAQCTNSFRVNTLGRMGTPEMLLMNAVEGKILDGTGFYKEEWLSPDTVLVACLVNPNLIVKKESYYCTVELQGKFTRGMMVVDRALIEQKPPNATVILEVNPTIYESMLIWAAGGPMPKL